LATVSPLLLSPFLFPFSALPPFTHPVSFKSATSPRPDLLTFPPPKSLLAAVFHSEYFQPLRLQGGRFWLNSQRERALLLYCSHFDFWGGIEVLGGTGFHLFPCQRVAVIDLTPCRVGDSLLGLPPGSFWYPPSVHLPSSRLAVYQLQGCVRAPTSFFVLIP
jgi:hypothetical protein